MDTQGAREWYAERIAVADELAARGDLWKDADAEILLCCAHSAIAAKAWKSQADKSRFVELLVKNAPAATGIQSISVPTLFGRLWRKHQKDFARRLVQRFYPKCTATIVAADEIDQPEAVVTELLPEVPLRVVRKCSYAGIIYTELRCGLVHEYALSQHLSSFCLSRRTDRPSYVPIAELDDAEVAALLRQGGGDPFGDFLQFDRTELRLYFPYPYIRQVLAETALAVFDRWDGAAKPGRRVPPWWWIEG